MTKKHTQPRAHAVSATRPAAAEPERLAEQLRELWAMTAPERVAAMRRGALNMRQCCAWAARYPDQLPRLNGEFEFLAAYLPEVAEGND
jgi:hypothetical protein